MAKKKGKGNRITGPGLSPRDQEGPGDNQPPTVKESGERGDIYGRLKSY